MWDARGARLAAVAPDGEDGLVGYYDGRASAAENWYERTGVATARWETGEDGRPLVGKFTAQTDKPAVESPHQPHTFRYITCVELPGGKRRFYYEAAREDGSHELRTEAVNT